MQKKTFFTSIDISTLYHSKNSFERYDHFVKKNLEKERREEDIITYNQILITSVWLLYSSLVFNNGFKSLMNRASKTNNL